SGGPRRNWTKASAGPAAGRGASTASAPAGSGRVGPFIAAPGGLLCGWSVGDLTNGLPLAGARLEALAAETEVTAVRPQPRLKRARPRREEGDNVTPARNRVTPTGDIEAFPLRGAWTEAPGIPRPLGTTRAGNR